MLRDALLYIFPYVPCFVFLATLVIIALRLLKRVVRAYVGDQGIDLPATLGLCLVIFMIFFCSSVTWVALSAPD